MSDDQSQDGGGEREIDEVPGQTIGNALNAYAQNSAALSHVAAAKAAVAPKTPNAKPYQNFQAMFEQFCAEPKGPGYGKTGGGGGGPNLFQ